MSLFRSLLGTTGLTAAVAPAAQTPPAPPAPAASQEGGLTEERVESALQAAQDQGRAAGAQAERERTATVFASEEGKANMAMAAWMLGANPSATAESICAQLKTMPAGATGGSPAPAASTEPPTALTTPLEQTPVAELNGKKPAAAANEGAAAEEDSNKMWDSVQSAGRERFIGSIGVAPAIAQGGASAAFQPRTGH